MKKKTSPSRIQSFSPSGCYAILGEGNDWGILFELGGIFFFWVGESFMGLANIICVSDLRFAPIILLF
jgi:hypothetical protein